MNHPFYSYSHNHLSQMPQFTSNNSPPPHQSITPIPSHHLSALNQPNQHIQSQQSSSSSSSTAQQFLQPQSQAASVVAAAASFYARSSAVTNDSFNRRHIQNVSSITPSSSSQSSSSSSSTPWKPNCLMENFKFESNTNLNNVFGGIEDSLFARAEALADISKATHLNMAKQQDNLYMAAAAAAASNHPSTITNHLHHSMSRHSFNDNTPADHQDHHHQQMLHQQQQMNHRFTPNSMAESAANSNPFYNFYHHSSMGSPQSSNHSHQLSQHSAAAIAAAAAISQHSEIDIDPRELETFAEKFKQRRIKLGVTQADVGQQLSKLKLPGVGSLSQSTICRFESLTLSHNNMIALKPVLHSWLEQAESDARNKRKNEEVMSTSSLTNSSSVSSVSLNSNSNLDRDRKRKRTSIAAPEKRSLEAFFSVQPRPSGEKIAQIAEKLDLKKNVVRVWFCNQRQKQKRMKFAAIQGR